MTVKWLKDSRGEMMRPVRWWHSILPLWLSCLDRTGLTCHWSADCCTGYNIKKCFYITGSNLHTCKLTLAQAKFNLLVLKWIISHPHFCYHSMCSILALGAHKGWLCVIFSGSVMDRTLMLILSGLQAFLLIIAFTSSASAAALVTVGSFTTAFKHEMTVSRI